MGKAIVRRYYFDACVFLSLIDGILDRVPSIHAIIEECENGGCEIFTSELSIAEVAFAQIERSNESLSVQAEQKIDELWHPTAPFQIVEVHQLIAFDAKNLIRKAMTDGWARKEHWSLKAHDGIHLATAKRHNVDAFLTYDKKLRKFGPSLGFEIRAPQPPQMLMFPSLEPTWIPRVPGHWRCLTKLRPLPIVYFPMRRTERNIYNKGIAPVV